MNTTSAIRQAAAGLSVCGIALFALGGAASADANLPDFVQDGKAGFVVSAIEFALASKDTKDSSACPNGLSEGYSSYLEAYLPKPEVPPRKEGEPQNQYQRRVFGAIRNNPDLKNLCEHPELGKPDPRFHTIVGSDVPVHGVDIDGQVSTADGTPAPGTCAHDDFVGVNGEKGIDNQFFRLVGCSNSFQASAGQSNDFDIVMLTGAWGILVTLSGVDDIKNDDDVEVGLYANADPIQLSPSREPLRDATYAIDQDPRFQATTHGRIKDGVLTTEPVDVRFHWVVNSMYLERPLDHARLRLTVGEDGTLDGYLYGYTNVQELWNMEYGFRNGKLKNGDPAPAALRNGSATGKAFTQVYTCEGAYYAMLANADGDRDPKTGKCTSLSTQYHLKAIPAFVVNEATQSANDELEGAGFKPDYGGNAASNSKE